jgi:hypothetical protein
LHLQRKDYIKFTKHISSLSQRALLSGPAGITVHLVKAWYCIVALLILNDLYIYVMARDLSSTGTEICQQYLVKALAKHFGARLLTVDSSMLLGVSF